MHLPRVASSGNIIATESHLRCQKFTIATSVSQLTAPHFWTRFCWVVLLVFRVVSGDAIAACFVGDESFLEVFP
jgi:hypothetical protein